MKPLGALVLGSALLGLGVGAARPDDADPEPPPPIKVSNIIGGATVKVKTGTGGPLIVITKGNTGRTESFQLTLPEKNAPTKVTLRYTNITQLPLFALMGKQVKEERFLPRFTGQGKQVIHFDDGGRQLKDETGARLSFTYAPAKDHIEIVMVCHKGKKWPNAPMRVSWSNRFGKKKD